MYNQPTGLSHPKGSAPASIVRSEESTSLVLFNVLEWLFSCYFAYFHVHSQYLLFSIWPS